MATITEIREQIMANMSFLLPDRHDISIVSCLDEDSSVPYTICVIGKNNDQSIDGFTIPGPSTNDLASAYKGLLDRISCLVGMVMTNKIDKDVAKKAIEHSTWHKAQEASTVHSAVPETC
ncbi:hypothetical protein BDV97DRAFT_395755 [Delphinella strobiligena]|nr:hypothetical protein BDV97DRAFT_395755 [Delphinella strobiligena]